jgi:hypothetical protein
MPSPVPFNTGYWSKGRIAGHILWNYWTKIFIIKLLVSYTLPLELEKFLCYRPFGSIVQVHLLGFINILQLGHTGLLVYKTIYMGSFVLHVTYVGKSSSIPLGVYNHLRTVNELYAGY